MQSHSLFSHSLKPALGGVKDAAPRRTILFFFFYISGFVAKGHDSLLSAAHSLSLSIACLRG